MTKIIAVTLRKGGSGKTTTSVNLATALTLKGKTTLLVDLDPQANATLSVGVDPLALDKHLHALFTDNKMNPADAIIVTDYGLHLLPSHPDLAKDESAMTPAESGQLADVLEPLKGIYDYIIIDTPPAENNLTINALVACDEVLIPLQTHYLAMRGLQDVMQEVEKVKKRLNPGIKVAGILPTMVNSRTNIAKTVLDEVNTLYGSLVYPLQVDYSVKHAEATLAGLPIVIYDKGHQGSKVYMKLADTIIKGGKE